jgi:hypothetical protein
MLLDLGVYEELVNNTLPVAKKYGLEQDLEMVGFEVKRAIFDLEKLMNKIEQCEKVVEEAA